MPLSFSKLVLLVLSAAEVSEVELKIENHIGAIWNFVHYYNANIALILSRQS